MSAMGGPRNSTRLPPASSRPKAGSPAPKASPRPQAVRSMTVFSGPGSAWRLPLPPSAQTRIRYLPLADTCPRRQGASRPRPGDTAQVAVVDAGCVGGGDARASGPTSTSTRVVSSYPTASRAPSGEKAMPKGRAPPGALAFLAQPPVRAVEADVAVVAGGREAAVRREGQAVDLVRHSPDPRATWRQPGVSHTRMPFAATEPCRQTIAIGRHLEVKDRLRQRAEPA